MARPSEVQDFLRAETGSETISIEGDDYMVRLAASDAPAPVPTLPPWQAAWIWTPEPTEGFHDFVYFRCLVNFDMLPETAWLRVTAEREYALWLNGLLLGRGPAQSPPAFKRFDAYAIHPYLFPGQNLLSALVYHDSRRTRLYPQCDEPGFLCQIDSPEETLLVTDGSWRCRLGREWRKPRTHFDDTTWPEFCDGRLTPHGWLRPEYDDADWLPAREQQARRNDLWASPQPPARFFPFVNLVPSEIQPLKSRLRRPRRVVRTGEIRQRREPTPDDTAVRMSIEPLKPPQKTYVDEPESLVQDLPNGCRIINSPLDEADDAFSGIYVASVVLDFGRLMNARLGFRIDADEGAVIDIGYAYRLEDERVVPYVSNRTPLADQYIAREGRQNWQSFQWRHFRFVQLTFRNLQNPLTLAEVWAEEQQPAMELRGHFNCTDPVLTKVYGLYRRTTELACADRTMDNPSRERRQYLGDGSGVLPAIWTLFGDTALARKYFHQAVEGQHATGLYRYSFPGHDDDRASLFDHSLSLPMRLYEHYWLFGDEEFVARVWPSVVRFLEFCDTLPNRDGLLDLPPYSVWYDWADIDREGRSFVLHALYMETLYRSLDLAAAAGETAPDRWRDRAETLRARLRREWYDEDRGVFVDALERDGTQRNHLSEHTNSLAILFAIANTEQIRRLCDIWGKTPELFARATPAWGHLPTAFVRAGRTDLAIDWVHRRFGPLQEQGFETVPELWHLDAEKTTGQWRPRNSRAVAQGCGLAFPWAVITEICGIRPLEPGFRRVHVNPRPGGLDHLEGVFPGPEGDIGMIYEQRKGGYAIGISLPMPRPVVLDLDLAGAKSPNFTVNGEFTPPETCRLSNGDSGWRVALRGSSRYEIKIQTGTEPPPDVS